MSDAKATTIPLAMWAGVGAAVLAATTYFEAHWFVWVAALTWLMLTGIAIILQSEQKGREYLCGTLRKSTYTQIYTGLIKRAHAYLWSAYCDQVDGQASLPAIFRAALTWRLYDRALLIAVLYPIFLPTLWWLGTGQAAKLGPVVFIEATGFWDVWPERAAVLGACVILILGKWFEKMATASPKRFWRSVSGWLPRVAFVIALGFAGAGAGAGAFAVVFVYALGFAYQGAGAFAVAVVLAFAGAFALAFAYHGAFAFAVAVVLGFAIAIAIAFAFAFAFAFTVKRLDERQRPQLFHLLVTIFAAAVWVAAAVLIPWARVDGPNKTIFVFLGVLPLINALFDVLSYATTLALIRRGLRAPLPVVYGLADLAVALSLLLTLGIAIVAVLAGLNALAGTNIIDLGALLRDLRDSPGDYWWLCAMAFSTILPTALHGLIALFGLQGLWPRSLRRRVAGWVDRAGLDAIDAARGAFALGLIWAVPVWVLVAAGWVIWHFTDDAAKFLAGKYLTSLEWTAFYLGAL